jgi:hypothetical protein
VTLDANAEFNEDTQKWELASTFQQAFCHDCDGETSLKKVTIENEARIKTNLERAQDFTIGQCISDYPDGATYDEIIQMLRDDARDEDDYPLVTVWQPLEDTDIVHVMENMVSANTRLLDE